MVSASLILGKLDVKPRHRKLRYNYEMTVSSTLTATSAALTASSVAAEKSPFDLAVWSVLPGTLWAMAAIGGLIYFRHQIAEVISAFVSRLHQGSSVKVGGVEIGAAAGLVATPGDFSSEDSRVGVFEDDNSRAAQRHDIYKTSRGAMLVHRLQKSNENGQLYDVLIYIIPHKSNLAGVVKVEYFFGSYWHNKVFPSEDRSRGFPVVTSAYGSFLCTAKLLFNDGTSEVVYRYIDFEMGALSIRHKDDT
jgi:hypothetical protein